MAFTCDRCLQGRHVRCERDGCACSICNTPRPVVHSRPKPPPGPKVAKPKAQRKPKAPRNPRRVPPVDEILALAENPDLSARAIAREVGFDPKTVLRVLRDANVVRPPKPPTPKPEPTPVPRPLSTKLEWYELRMVQILRSTGAPHREIAGYFGVSESMIQQLLPRLGTEPIQPPTNHGGT